MGLERHGQFLLLGAQLHLPLVQVDGKAEDVVDFPWCDLQRFPSPTVPPAAPWPIKRPAVGIISDAYIIDFATLEVRAEPTQLRELELAQDLDFVIKLASALGQVWGTAGEPIGAVRRCGRWFQSSEPNQLGLRAGTGTCQQQRFGHGAVGVLCPCNVQGTSFADACSVDVDKPRRNSTTIK